jgi:membrane protein
MTSFRIIYRAGAKWVEHQDAKMGAALAYYALFSIAPLLILAVHIAGLVFGADAARGKVVEHLQHYIDVDSARMIQSLLQDAGQLEFGSWAALGGLAAVVAGALGIFLHVRDVLCKVFKLAPPHENTFLAILVDYFLAILMVLITGLLLLGSLAASTALALLSDVLNDFLSLPWQLLEAVVSFAFLTLVFAAVYRVLSGNRLPWGYVWYGAAICSLLFTLGKTLLGFYLAYTSSASAYGAAGSLVVFLIWVYYSAQLLFFGAELIQARRTRAEWM